MSHFSRRSVENLSPQLPSHATPPSGSQLSRNEFVVNVQSLFRNHPGLWRREVHKVAEAAFSVIQVRCAPPIQGLCRERHMQIAPICLAIP